MAMDRLSSLLERFSLRANVYFQGALCGVHTVGAGDTSSHLHLIEQGTGQLVMPGCIRSPIPITEPTLVWLPRPRTHSLEMNMGHASTTNRALCARVDFGLDNNPLLQAMPPVLVLPLQQLPSLASTLDILFNEAFQPRCGSQAVIERLCELLLIQLLRYCIEHQLVATSVIAGLSEPRLAKAITAMHDKPQTHWTLDTLAQRAGMSRARFASLFKSTVGTTPGDYLSTWRMGLSRDLLRSGQSVARTAHAVGYKSASAFIHAFGVAHGMSPHTWIKARQAQDPHVYLSAPRLEQHQLGAG